MQQFYFTHRLNPVKRNNSRLERTRQQCHLRVISRSPELLQQIVDCHIQDTHCGVVLTPLQIFSRWIQQGPTDWAILWCFYLSIIWRYTCTIFIHNLPRLRTKNVSGYNERKLFHTKKQICRRYYAYTITDAEYVENLLLLVNAPAKVEYLYCLEQTARGKNCMWTQIKQR